MLSISRLMGQALRRATGKRDSFISSMTVRRPDSPKSSMPRLAASRMESGGWKRSSISILPRAQSTVLEQSEVAGLLRGEVFGDQPCLEILSRFFFAGFKFSCAKGRLDKINEVAAGAAVGPAEVVLVEVVAAVD